MLTLGKPAQKRDCAGTVRHLYTGCLAAVHNHIHIAAVNVIRHAGMIRAVGNDAYIAGKGAGDFKAGAGPVHLQPVSVEGGMTQHLEQTGVGKLRERHTVHLIPTDDLSRIVQPITENRIEVTVCIQCRIIEIAAVAVGDRQRIIKQHAATRGDHAQLELCADSLGINRGIALCKGGIIPCIPRRGRAALHKVAVAGIQIISAAGEQQRGLSCIAVTDIADHCTRFVGPERQGNCRFAAGRQPHRELRAEVFRLQLFPVGHFRHKGHRLIQQRLRIFALVQIRRQRNRLRTACRQVHNAEP